MARKATSQDVADLAGVSRSAVSLVLNGHGAGNIAAAKQDAIFEAARQLNYTPNAVALSLRSQRTRTIGVIIWGGAAPSTWSILHAALQTAALFGHFLLIMDSHGDPGIEASVIATLRDRQVDGFLVISPVPGPYTPPDAMHSTPTVLANCTDPELTVISVTVDSDDDDALGAVGDQAVRRLLGEMAHEREPAGTISVEQTGPEESGAEESGAEESGAEESGAGDLTES
jgi:LacI family transcriptional regulator